MALPLSPYLVVDLTTGRSGPTAVRQLADWGARTVRVEQPADGDVVSAFRLGADYQNLHRNKESVVIDLKSRDGHDVFCRLVERADVLIENFRPGVTERLGVDYAAMAARNPRLVYGTISGFGSTGPYAARPGLDQVAQGMSGLMSVTGLPGQGPVRAGIAVADSGSGIYLACGVLTALLERERTGTGRWVRTSLVESLVALMDFQAARYLVDGVCPEQEGNSHPTIAPMGVFPAADGLFNLAPVGNAGFVKLCELLDAPELPQRDEFASLAARAEHRSELNVIIAERTRKKTAAEWIELCNEAGIPAGPILSIAEMWEDPQMEHLRLAVPVEHPDLGEIELVGQPFVFADDPTNRGVRTPTPPRGAHTDAWLAELGYDDRTIAALRAAKVVA